MSVTGPVPASPAVPITRRKGAWAPRGPPSSLQPGCNDMAQTCSSPGPQWWPLRPLSSLPVAKVRALGDPWLGTLLHPYPKGQHILAAFLSKRIKIVTTCPQPRLSSDPAGQTAPRIPVVERCRHRTAGRSACLPPAGGGAPQTRSGEPPPGSVPHRARSGFTDAASLAVFCLRRSVSSRRAGTRVDSARCRRGLCPSGVLRGGGVTHGGASPPPVATCADSAVLSVTRGGVTCSGVTCGSASPPPVVTCADSAVLPVTLALSPSRMPRIILPGSSSGNLQGTWAPTPEAESAPLAPESGCPLAPVFPGCPLPSPMPCPALGKQRRTPGNPERGSPALGASVPQGVCRVPGTPFHFSWQKCVKSVTTAAGAD